MTGLLKQVSNAIRRISKLKKSMGFIKQYWSTALIVVLLVLLYKFISDNRIYSATVFPSIDKVAANYQTDILEMLSNIGSSFSLVLPSLAWTLVIAIGLGVLMGRSKFARTSLYPIVYAMSCVPSILLTPFLLLLCPNYRVAAIIIIVYGIIWSTLFSTITGMEAIDPRYMDNAKTLNLKGFKLLFHVMLPAAAPAIIGGFINSLRASFVMLVFGEMYGTNTGLGYYVKYSANHGMYDRMWAGLVFMVLVVLVVMQLFTKLKERMLRWTD